MRVYDPVYWIVLDKIQTVDLKVSLRHTDPSILLICQLYEIPILYFVILYWLCNKFQEQQVQINRII